ncbi:PREDICTED: protein Skeletor, isoforms B/C-like [Priapulus caudatus]|uniref:Protein Skeletor, isoforms B/C-like n=1 Tax=Priapulus caudatus TaxID=37621 RepID=A0ABM1EDV6_PRICU|nr:PREDICTED: protein Skeletor, isoforms B/C-like [Priapulus caudatus]
MTSKSENKASEGIYYGNFAGKFEDSVASHDVAGNVYIMDKKTLFVKGFVYDGQAPGAVMWVGTSGTRPSGNGVALSISPGAAVEPLEKFDGTRDLTLSLPGNLEAGQLAWLSVWCDLFTVDFGHVLLANMLVPEPVTISGFAFGAHNIMSGPVTLKNEKTLIIEDFSYDGNGPGAYFTVGVGRPSVRGYKVPDENGSDKALDQPYEGTTIELTLPDGVTFHDVEYFSIYCFPFRADFGHFAIPEIPRGNLPSSLATPKPKKSSSGVNCETMLPDVFNVAWLTRPDAIHMIFTGRIEPGTYMAFGVSGSQHATSMLNADATVAWIDTQSNLPRAEDYFLRDYAQCTGVSGACPDTQFGGTNDVIVQGFKIANGTTGIYVIRKLLSETGDNKHDKAHTGVKNIVWAIGPINNDGIVSKHSHTIQGIVRLDFERTPVINCNELPQTTDEPKQEVQVWPPRILSGIPTRQFHFTMGPSGGKPGYTGTTGQVSWGIAYWVNGLLIPKLVLKRGETYIFIIETGNNPSHTASYHPVYITSDPIGGFIQNTEQERQSLLGGVYYGIDGNQMPSEGATGSFCEYTPIDTSLRAEDTASFEEYKANQLLQCEEPRVPGVFQWRPDARTPQTLYYQCFQHRYLGWKIEISDE